MRSLKKLIAAVLPLSLLGLVASQTTNAADILPRSNFPMCSDARNIYCIESVTFIEIAGEKPGVWYPTGSQVIDASGAPSAAVFPTFTATTAVYPGRFSYEGFDTAVGYDGVYVKVGPANEFTDSMMIAFEPAGPGADGKVARVKDETTGYVRGLNPDTSMRVVIRLGALIPAITAAVSNTEEFAKSIANKSVDDDGIPVITFQGAPVPVPIARSPRDCADETGVAAAKPYQLYALVAFENSRDPFGIPGLSGDILISSNGACKLTTPTWSAETLSFSFTASAPHFAPDGTTVNRGFYRAFIPTTDAAMLFGLSNAKQAATGLDLVFEETEGGAVSVEKRVAVQKAKTRKVIDPKTKKKVDEVVRAEQIVISFTNFQFSSPKMTVRVKQAHLAKFKAAQKRLVVKSRAIHKKLKN